MQIDSYCRVIIKVDISRPLWVNIPIAPGVGVGESENRLAQKAQGISPALKEDKRFFYFPRLCKCPCSQLGRIISIFFYYLFNVH